MKISVSRIKIFRIKNRRGYAALCQSHLTEGKTIFEAYARMLKALRRSKVTVTGNLTNIKRLLVSMD
ncbi:MAG: hypothetical protein ABH865_00790 [Candidatus Omnitrophota bacterium]|nr:hypothetical protein [Candidatus Omnitrophota bacterium]